MVAKSRQVKSYERQSRSHGLQFGLTVLVCMLIAAGYVAAMRALMEVSLLSTDADIERRDEIFLAIHVGVILFAGISGFLLGKWFNGLGLAYGLLFMLITAVLMMVVLLGSYELACQGHNGLVRHWQCGP